MEQRRSKAPLFIIPVILILIGGLVYWYMGREVIVSPVPEGIENQVSEKVIFVSPRPTPTDEPVASPSATLVPTKEATPKPTTKPTAVNSASATVRPTVAATNTPAATATTAPPTATSTP